MPEAWFMGNDIYFFESLDRDSHAKEVCRALDEIRGGINAFPKVSYIPLWKAWFRYLLPDLIVRANDLDNFNNYTTMILVKTIVTFFNIYPDEIAEEYSGFREDIVGTLGTRAIPYPLAREVIVKSHHSNRLFIDLWDADFTIKHYGFCSFAEANSSILFCLKYLTPKQILIWTLSLFQIESPQWYLQMIFSLMAWRKLLALVNAEGSNEGNLQEVIRSSEIFGDYWVPKFKSFDEFISTANVQAFEQVIAEQFTFDVFRTWKDEILKELNISKYNLENDPYLTRSFEEIAQIAAKIFF